MRLLRRHDLALQEKQTLGRASRVIEIILDVGVGRRTGAEAAYIVNLRYNRLVWVTST